VGIGFDAHRFAPDRRLVLGGVEVPFPLGLSGHSDADVLVHAVIDALLGAAGAGDIGTYFPDDDPRWRGASSLLLLEEAVRIARRAGWRPYNCDAVVVCERPRLSPHVRRMKANVARALGVDEGMVNVKATTTEGMGFTGRGEGIAAYAVVMVQGEEDDP